MIKVILDNEVPVPQYETPGSAGIDVRANKILKIYKGDVEIDADKLLKIQQNFDTKGYINLRGSERVLFGTGITIADMSDDIEIQVRSRSGVTLKRGLVVANSPGTIDSDYRNEIGVIILNTTPFLSRVEKRERIAQLVVSKVEKQTFEVVEEISHTNRKGGFGSTGTK